jgi:hypothetical protein
MSSEILVIQTRTIAINLLKHNSKLLGQNEAAVLNNFLQKTFKQGAYTKITERQCHKIINMATTVNQRITRIRDRRTRALPA